MAHTPFHNITRDQIRDAIETTLRQQAEAPARRLSQNLNITGSRTQGVGLIPVREAARQRASNLAAGTIGLGGQDIEQRFTAEENEKNRQFELAALRERLRAEADTSRTRARQSLQGGTVAAGLGFAGEIARILAKK